MSDWPPGSPGPEEIGAWCQALRPIADRPALERSSFWRREGPAVTRLLRMPHAGGPGEREELYAHPAHPAHPAHHAPGECGAPSRVRIVHWNILKGIAFEEIARALGTHPRLAGADVILLNEVDVGMARSRNLHVAAELARRLGLYWVFQPNYLELTKGPGRDAAAPGENETGLQGVAILSRVRPVAHGGIPLPEGFDMFAFGEKRLGQRVGLVAALPGGLAVGTAHHEVRGSPGGRAVQMQAFLGGVEAFRRRARSRGQGAEHVLLSGDLNTHTFARGSARRTAAGALRLLATPRAQLVEQFDQPWRGGREPLFAVMAEAGYRWGRLNAAGPTAHAPLALIEEGDGLAAPLRRLLQRLLPFRERGIPLHLDWFFGRDLPSEPAATRIIAELEGEGAPSDHAPIVVDFPGGVRPTARPSRA